MLNTLNDTLAQKGVKTVAANLLMSRARHYTTVWLIPHQVKTLNDTMDDVKAKPLFDTVSHPLKPAKAETNLDILGNGPI